MDLKAQIAKADKPALEKLVDDFFAGLEARTTSSVVKGILEGANAIVDLVLSKYGL